MFYCTFTFLCLAQKSKIEIVGKIYESDGRKALSNATISVVRGSQKVTTNTEGDFSIYIDHVSDSLYISSVGFASKSVAATYFLKTPILYLNTLSIVLEEAVVQTGYQTLKAIETTGAVEVINNEQLNLQTGANILQRLNNITAGLAFDHSAQKSDLQKLNFSVRGLSTINGNLDPLIVLDGYIYEGNIENIDPNLIESITILKDAAASAIWGARAGNGVVVITSKRGSFSAQQRTKVTFNHTSSFQEKSQIEDLYQLSNVDFISVEKMLFDQGYYDDIYSFVAYGSLSPVINIFDQRKKGLISVQDSASAIMNLLNQNGKSNYSKAFLNTALLTQDNLHISGGGSKNAYGFGVGYTNDHTELDANNRKINFTLSNSYRPIERLQVDVLLNYSNTHHKSGLPNFSSLKYGNKSVPYLQFYDSSGEQLPFELEYRQSYMDQYYAEGYLDWGYYPLSEYKHRRIESRLNEWFTGLKMNYRINSYANFSLGGQYQFQENILTDQSDMASYYARNYINQFTEYKQGITTYNVPLGGIKNMKANELATYTLRGQFNIDKTFADHKLIGILGFEMREAKIHSSNFTTYGFNDDPLQSKPVDFAKSFQIIPSNGYRNISGSPSFGVLNNRFISAYTDWKYIFKDTYGISASFRRDGANIFGANTNEKWSPLWSTGIFMNLDKFGFMNRQWINALKLRTTYGYSGNVDLRKTPDPIAFSGIAAYTNYPMLVISELNDPSLRWEKIGTWNIGLDYSILANRLSGSLDYYIKNGTDLYGLTNYDYTTWGLQGTIVKNVAAMRATGIDLNLRSININRKFQWSTNLIFNFNKNKTTEYYNTGSNNLLSYLGNGMTIQPVVGRPLNGLAAYTWKGLNDEGQPQGILNGNITSDYAAIRTAVFNDPTNNETIKFLGSSKPQLFGNLINTFSYKKYSLAFNISYKGGYYFQKPVTNYYSLYYFGEAFPDFEKRWKVKGDELHTQVPSMQYPENSLRDAFYENSEINILKAGHIRLAYISFSYRGSISFNERQFNFQIFGNASNLGLLWTQNKEGIDPDFPYQLGLPRNYAAGIKMDF